MDTFGVPDSKLMDWLIKEEYLITADEGEATAMAAGYYLATGKVGTVFCNADGFLNVLNPLTSLLIPYQIPVNFVISYGRKEPQHIIASESLKKLIELYVNKGRSTFEFIG
jgi:phosphonopyruvate decarboxylase